MAYVSNEAIHARESLVTREQNNSSPPDAAPAEEDIPHVVNGQELTPVQRQALREAKARHDAQEESRAPKEVGGADRDTDPSRYGDWEKDGRAVDFS